MKKIMKDFLVKYFKLITQNLILLDQGIVSFSRFLLTLIIAKNFGIQEYGVYVILWSFILFMGSIQIPLIINPLMSLGSKSLHRGNNYFFSTYFYFQVGFSLVSILLLFGIYFISNIFFISFDFEMYLCLVLYGICYNFYEYYRRFFFTISKEKKVLITDFFIYITMFSLIGLMLFFDFFNLKLFFLQAFFTYAIAVIFLSHHFQLQKVKANFLLVRFKKNHAYSLPMLKMSIMQFISGHFFIYLASLILGSYSAGIIGMLRNIFAPLIVVLMVIDNTMPKKAMYYYENQPSALVKYINTNIVKWGLIFLCFIIIVMIFSEPIINLLYGSEYVEFSTYMVWFSLAHIVMLIVRSLSIYCRTIQEMETFTRQGIVSFCFTLIFTYPLIKFIGLNGAFLVMLVQQFLILFVLVKDSRYYELFRR